MKRRYVHLVFWIGYWLLTVYFEYLWLNEYAGSWPLSKMIGKAFLSSSIYILPYMALAYYLVYVVLTDLVKRRKTILVQVLLILLPYLAAVFLVVLIARGIVLPVIYENVFPVRSSFVDPRKFFSILVEAAFPAAVLMGMRYVDSLLQAKEREKGLIREKMNAELQLLKNQLNPHFLFNTLNNLYALTRKKSDQAPDVVMKLSELLSFMLYEANQSTISIQKEVAFLEDYIALQRIRYTDGLSLRFTKEIDNPAQPIAPLLLLPLVENAFKHGASENHNDSFIYIHLKLHRGGLTFLIENSFESAVRSKGNSTIGLNNTMRQLELIYAEQKINISNHNNVFKVELAVNLDSYGKI